MNSEHYTYKRAAEGLWDSAVEALKAFDKRYQEAHTLFDRDSVEDLDKLLKDFAFMKNDTAPSFSGPFYDWMNESFVAGDFKVYPESVRPRGRMILEVIDGQHDIVDFFEALERYKDALNSVVQDIAPASFIYQGFKIANPERLGDKMARRLLEGVDYVVALFKKRGLEPMLSAGVREVEILPNPVMKKQNATAAGLYDVHRKTIMLSNSIVNGNASGRFVQWVNEVFLHEFGHHVHLNYLPKAAKQEWDSAWGEVREKQEAVERAFKSITAVERAKFFEALRLSKFEPSQAVKKLDPVGKVKFGVWLRNPLMGDPLITEKQLRWSKDGKRIALFFTDQPQFMAENYSWMVAGEDEYERQLVRSDKLIRDKLGLLWDGALSIPVSAVQDLAEADPTMQKAVKDALDKLEIVSPYGRTNDMEDFAETFVAFVGAPEKLTPTAKFRMQRTLSLANFYNKPVMRLSSENDSLSQHVVSRFVQALAVDEDRTHACP